MLNWSNTTKSRTLQKSFSEEITVLTQKSNLLKSKLTKIYLQDSILLQDVLLNVKEESTDEEILSILKSLNWKLLQIKREIGNE